MTDGPTFDDLLLRGQAAARVGHRDEARRLLRRAVGLAPDNVQALLALAGVEEEAEAKRRCFNAVLARDADNAEARLGLDLLEGREDELEAVLAEASRRLDAPALRAGPAPADAALFCANHPSVETRLRCNRCSKPICTRCAVRTPVGYRCRQCVGQQQAVFYTGGAGDLAVGGVLALLSGGLVAFLMSLLGAWFFALILGPAVGVAVAELVRTAVRRRRSRHLWLVVAGGMAVGALPTLLIALARLNLWSLLTVGLFLALAIASASARLR